MTEKFHAKTYKGLEEVLGNELREIGAEQVEVVNRGVNFSGSTSMMYKANLYLRTALRILKPIAAFKAFNEQILYKKIYDIDWSQFMTFKNSLTIDAVVFSKEFRNSHFIEQRVKDAIVDQFRKKTSLRPSIDKKNADIRINVHVAETYFTISLDSSGESLHKRGYRKKMHPASLSEVLAAGLIKLSGWDGETNFLNPMCGSGTIAIEAAMIGRNILPGSIGRGYSFQSWKDFDDLLFNRILEAMPVPVTLKNPIFASDIDPQAISIAKSNIRGIGLQQDIRIEKEDFFEAHNSIPNSALVLINPPYGERLEMENINDFYRQMGSVLKHKYEGATSYIFTSNLEAIKHLGLKPELKQVVYNSNLECRFFKYSIFKGARKDYISSSI